MNREVIRELKTGQLAAIAKLMGVDVRVSNTYDKDHPNKGDGKPGKITFTAFGDSETWTLPLPDGQDAPYPMSEILRAWDHPADACQALEDVLQSLPDEIKRQVEAVLASGIVGWARAWWDEMQEWQKAIATCPGMAIIQRPATVNGKRTTETIMTSTKPSEKLKREWNL